MSGSGRRQFWNKVRRAAAWDVLAAVLGVLGAGVVVLGGIPAAVFPAPVTDSSGAAITDSRGHVRLDSGDPASIQARRSYDAYAWGGMVLIAAGAVVQVRKPIRQLATGEE